MKKWFVLLAMAAAMQSGWCQQPETAPGVSESQPPPFLEPQKSYVIFLANGTSGMAVTILKHERDSWYYVRVGGVAVPEKDALYQWINFDQVTVVRMVEKK